MGQCSNSILSTSSLSCRTSEHIRHSNPTTIPQIPHTRLTSSPYSQAFVTVCPAAWPFQPSLEMSSMEASHDCAQEKASPTRPICQHLKVFEGRSQLFLSYSFNPKSQHSLISIASITLLQHIVTTNESEHTNALPQH